LLLTHAPVKTHARIVGPTAMAAARSTEKF
jgi:hypothetical protein